MVASIIAIDVAAILCVVAALSVGVEIGSSGPRTGYRTFYNMLDGSTVIVTYNSAIGKTIGRTVVRPATVVGLCLVWWPAAAAATLTALALTPRGGRYIAEFQPPRMTLKRLMVAVAFLGADVGWSLRTLEPSRGSFLFGGWRPIYMDIFILNVQVLLAASIAILLYRARLRGTTKTP